VSDCRKGAVFLRAKSLSACLSLALAGGTVPSASTCAAAISPGTIPDGTHVHALAPRSTASAEHPRVVTHPVVNCDDSGLGSLRDVVAGAGSGDTVDMGQLSCSTITLTSGAIVVGQQDLPRRLRWGQSTRFVVVRQRRQDETIALGMRLVRQSDSNRRPTSYKALKSNLRQYSSTPNSMIRAKGALLSVAMDCRFLARAVPKVSQMQRTAQMPLRIEIVFGGAEEG